MSILCNFIFRLILNSKLKEIQILSIPTIPVLWSFFKKGFSTNYLCVPLCHYYSADTSTLVVWRRTRTRGGKPYRPSCLSAFLTTLSSVSLPHQTAPHIVSIFFEWSVWFWEYTTLMLDILWLETKLCVSLLTESDSTNQLFWICVCIFQQCSFSSGLKMMMLKMMMPVSLLLLLQHCIRQKCKKCQFKQTIFCPVDAKNAWRRRRGEEGRDSREQRGSQGAGDHHPHHHHQVLEVCIDLWKNPPKNSQFLVSSTMCKFHYCEWKLVIFTSVDNPNFNYWRYAC